MKVHLDLHNLPEFRNSVITIGSFDGVHQGHRKIIEQIVALARQSDGESVVITFHPHPRSIVYPKDQALRLITSIEEKIECIRPLGIDHLVVAPFTIEFSQINADEYIEKFLVGKFKPRTIVIGYDHRFGLGRQGDIHYLRWHAEKFGYTVVEIPQQLLEDAAVSSTKIRKALEQGDVATANRFMGHYFPLRGKVVRGQQIGRTLGFPTANLEIAEKNKLVPPAGIYAIFATLGQKWLRGMLYVGTRPTLKAFPERTIEAHLFDFSADIYDQTLHLEVVSFLRPDQQFSGLPALQAQLQRDQVAAELALLNAPLNLPLPGLLNPAPAVAIVILNFNGRNYLEQFLPNLLEPSSYSNLRIIVADNASTDDSVAYLTAYHPQVEVIRLEKNYGYAEGYNRALSQVNGAEYFVLLNSDIAVTPGWIEPIIKRMELDPKIAAAQPKILSFANPTEFEYAGAAGGWIDRLGYPFCRGRIFATTEVDQGQYDRTEPIFWATGAALFIRAKLFQSSGGFDGDYFAHAEEIDLCWRLKKAGFKVIACPESVVYHVGGGTLAYNTPRKTRLNFRNTLVTLVKNESLANLWWMLPARLLLDAVAGLLFLSQGRPEHVRAIIQAHWDFFPQWRHVWRKRQNNLATIAALRENRPPDATGRYPHSIVAAYYLFRKRFFTQLPPS